MDNVRRLGKRINHGFEKVERLPGNIGYIDLRGFFDPDFGAETVAAATGGGAHPGGNFRITDHFSAFVSTGRAINPITKTNWEGTGVKPDVEVITP